MLTWSLIWRSMGSTKASVLPEPVLAMPMQSRPLMMAGSACAWMGMGLMYFILRSTSSALVCSPHCVQVFTGFGLSLPLTCRMHPRASSVQHQDALTSLALHCICMSISLVQVLRGVASQHKLLLFGHASNIAWSFKLQRTDSF